LRFHSTDTRFGKVSAVWDRSHGESTVQRVYLSKGIKPSTEFVKTGFPDAEPGTCSMVDGLLADIRRFLEGEDVPFSLEHVALGRCSGFQRSVLLAEHGIPRGSVSTYGSIAAYLSVPGGARAVGRALSTNPFPVIIPCHRAIRSDGSLGGYQGGVEMKRALLGMEGVEFDGERVKMNRVFY